MFKKIGDRLDDPTATVKSSCAGLLHVIASCLHDVHHAYACSDTCIRQVILKTISIVALCSSTAQSYWTILSGAGVHGECATFEVWVEVFGAELVFLLCLFR